MIEVMVPSMLWDNEEWIIRNIKNPSDSLSNLKYCDGQVKNIIFDVENMKNYKIAVEDLFDTYSWIDKVIFMKKDNVKVFSRR